MIGALAAAEIGALCKDAGLPVLYCSSPIISQVTWVAIQVRVRLSIRLAEWVAEVFAMRQFNTSKLPSLRLTPEQLRKRVGDLIFNHKAGYTIHRLVLVGGDIDVFDDKDVMWAFSTRCRPGHDEVSKRKGRRDHQTALLTTPNHSCYTRIARASPWCPTCRMVSLARRKAGRLSRMRSCPPSNKTVRRTGLQRTSRSKDHEQLVAVTTGPLIRTRPLSALTLKS
jgi:hypothetical protein